MRTIINISTVVDNSTTQKVFVYKSLHIHTTSFWVVLLGTVNEDQHQHQYCCQWQYSTVPNSIIRTLQYPTVLNSTQQYSKVFNSIGQYPTVLNSTQQYCRYDLQVLIHRCTKNWNISPVMSWNNLLYTNFKQILSLKHLIIHCYSPLLQVFEK